MQWLKAKLVERQFWTETLFSIKVEAKLEPYKAGQYAQLGMMMDGELVKRAYSFVNSPSTSLHEFYLVDVAGGQLSPQLARVPLGSELQIADHASGFFTLDEVPKAHHLLMLSTGTAVGPFLAMLQEQQCWQQFERITLVQGVRYNQDINYQQLIDKIAEEHANFQFIPLVSRESPEDGLFGRITDAIATEELTEYGQFTLSSELCQVMICGNPAMVKQTREMLKDRNFARNLRRKPGQLTVENYW
ncbi:ferredoxin--NADP reductase [Celerinatantimonas diazotrophica]|uniref:ferredoxin--NADP(+) reductase n=1 Tax=Celerinatantimonas diazotrophica TaxID=412034 RepID=A0A4V2PRA3_9GAMM|nr:ferredoxin--NADP reductase [Celerinatantimonas diazotrophica]TCK58011.1 ferredoxin--NADP+ reductase [Celerinatantimonas diazotrophica]CAG9297920.1 Flavodoxin/ferredoxin--NADP reductase [Celerinatantimonas diazotrophica]